MLSEQYDGDARKQKLEALSAAVSDSARARELAQLAEDREGIIAARRAGRAWAEIAEVLGIASERVCDYIGDSDPRGVDALIVEKQRDPDIERMEQLRRKIEAARSARATWREIAETLAFKDPVKLRRHFAPVGPKRKRGRGRTLAQ